MDGNSSAHQRSLRKGLIHRGDSVLGKEYKVHETKSVPLVDVHDNNRNRNGRDSTVYSNDAKWPSLDKYNRQGNGSGHRGNFGSGLRNSLHQEGSGDVPVSTYLFLS